MVEIGKVVKVKKNKAYVQFDRKSACDSCHMCATTKNGMKVQTVIENKLKVNVGDYVEVEMGDKFVLTAAFVVYIIPLILIGAGIGIGSIWGEIWEIVLAMVGLVVGFMIAIGLDKLLKKKKGFTPQMTRVADATEIERKPLDFSNK